MDLPPQLPENTLISIDIETRDDGLKDYGPGVRRGSYIIGIAVAYADGVGRIHSWYLPFNHETGFNHDESAVKQWCKDNLCRPNQPKTGANLMYDLDFLWHWGVRVTGPFYDIQVAEPLLDETRKSYSLNNIAKTYLDEEKTDEGLLDWVRNNIGGRIKDPYSYIWRVPSEIIEGYAKGDVELPLRVFDIQKQELKRKNLWDLFMLEVELLPMLLDMRQKGVRIDVKKVQQLEIEYEREIGLAQTRLNDIAGIEVNPNAGASIALACDRLGIKYPLTAKTKAPSFTRPWMEGQSHELFKTLLDLRQFQKQQTTFLQGSIDKYLVNGRIHCLFHPLKSDSHGTVSGRFSSSNPNLQFIPARHPVLGPATRGLFLPEEGHTWAKFDYSAIEPRVTLHYAEGAVVDKAISMLKEDQSMDIYKPMMEMLPHLPRKVIKTIYLGTAYGMGSEKLSNQLGIPTHEAMKVIADFNRALPYIRNLSKACMQRADKVGYIRTFLGRRRHFNTFEPSFNKLKQPPLPRRAAAAKWGNRIRRAYTYKAMNALIQGTSADIMKKAMLDLYKSGVCDEIGVPMITCHDEVDFSIPPGNDKMIPEIKNIMENTVNLEVPLAVDVETGESWNVTK